MFQFSLHKSVHTAPPGARLLLLFRLFGRHPFLLFFWLANMSVHKEVMTPGLVSVGSLQSHFKIHMCMWISALFVSLVTVWTLGKSISCSYCRFIIALRSPKFSFRWISLSSYFQTALERFNNNPHWPLSNSGLQARWLLPLRHRPPPHRPQAHWPQQSCWLWPTLRCHRHPPLHRTLGYRWSAGDRMNQQTATALST